MEKISNMERYSGVYALMLTPYNEDRSIDYNTYEKYVEWQVSQGAQHLFPVCGSSEMAILTLEERIKLAELTVKNANGTHIIATANLEPSWEAQVDEVKRMEQTGVDTLIFVTKGYGNDDERMYTYFCDLASKTTLPVMIYEFPGYPNNKISGKVYGRMVETGRCMGIKDTTCTMEGIKDKIAYAGDSAVIQANIPFLLDSYYAGAKGVIATPSGGAVKILRKMWDAFQAGDAKLANEGQQAICMCSEVIGDGFAATAKYLINLQGGVKMNILTRSNPNPLSAQKLKSIEVFYDWASSNGWLDK